MAAFLCSAGILPAILNFEFAKENGEENDIARCAKSLRARCDVRLAQAGMPVLLKGAGETPAVRKAMTRWIRGRTVPCPGEPGLTKRRQAAALHMGGD
jgi:hypothetical protein